MDALINYYFKIDPRKLTDKEWAKKYNQLEYIKKLERNMLLGVMRQVISESFSDKK